MFSYLGLAIPGLQLGCSWCSADACGVRRSRAAPKLSQVMGRVDLVLFHPQTLLAPHHPHSKELMSNLNIFQSKAILLPLSLGKKRDLLTFFKYRPPRSAFVSGFYLIPPNSTQQIQNFLFFYKDTTLPKVIKKITPINSMFSKHGNGNIKGVWGASWARGRILYPHTLTVMPCKIK